MSSKCKKGSTAPSLCNQSHCIIFFLKTLDTKQVFLSLDGKFVCLSASYVNLCKRTDPDLSECFKKAVEHLKPYLAEGIPEMEVPPLNPFIVPKMSLSTGNGTSFELDFEATDGIAYGANDFDVLDAKTDFDNGKYVMTLEFKSMNITGHYKVKGRVMVFHLDASGPFEIYLSKYT